MADQSVRCTSCGITFTASTEAELVKKLQAHAKEAHNIEMSEETAKAAIKRGYT